MRRLPVYFLIDVSESMIGEPIAAVQQGIKDIMTELKRDPYALETAYISIIAFAGKAKTIMPLTEAYKFQYIELPIGGGTSIGAAINFLSQDIEHNVVKSSIEQKGDWKPIVFLFTDGKPTDNYTNAINTWNRKYKSRVNLIAISIGNNADISVLSKITDTVLVLHNTNQQSFKEFFKWVSASIKSSSVSVANTGNNNVVIEERLCDGLSKINLEKSKNNNGYDDRFAVVLGKCKKTKSPYLIKYEKTIESSGYTYVGAFPVEHSYFDLSDSSTHNSINTSLFDYFPECPCCGNQYGFSICSCGNVMCVGSDAVAVCPWCNQHSEFEITEDGIDVSRTIG